MISKQAAYHELYKSAQTAGQSHIFRDWDALSEIQQQQLLLQIKSIHFNEITNLAQHHIHDDESTHFSGKIEPVHAIPIPKTTEQKLIAQKMCHIGEEALQSGEVGVLLVAGGQGSRLGFDGPKGIFPITPVLQKSLFHLHAEKIKALSVKYRTRLPFYIMTSQANHAATLAFFAKHDYFGLDSADVFFFQQGMLPALDGTGKMIIDAPGHLFMNPNGHGGVLEALAESSALADMQKRGLQHIYYFQVDNVLAKICDPVFLGYHIEAQAEMSSKVVAKRDAYEKVGVIGKIDGKLGVIEYSDLSEQDKTATTDTGELRYNAGSIAIHIIDVAFIQQFAQHDLGLPWHVAHKKIPYLNEDGQLVQPDAPNGYKFEKFIFDALAFVNKSVVMEVDRDEEFSPVKNSTGEDSPQTAQQAMSRLFAKWLRQAGFTIAEPGLPKIEISSLFATDADEFCAKFSGQGKIDSAFYIE
ncbi:UDPGP type 1 family protein [candidate division KSB1 bacterium]|nr:UDPGP type 1 family protein [candidate division KSB1 bacterium]